MYTILVNGQDICNFQVVSGSELPAVKTAAWELQNYLKTSAENPVGRIHIGLVQDFPQLASWEKTVQKEGIFIQIAGADIYIAGGSGRGVLYAAYEFLEKFCGWRFFTPELETEPQGTVNLEDQTYQYNPRFDFRMILLPLMGEDTLHYQKRHLNSRWGSIPMEEERGGSVFYADSNAHTFQDLLPEKEYYDEHPEYFAVDENGNPLRDSLCGTPPCLSHPDVFEIMLGNARKILQKNPKAKFISVSQNDGPHYCHCPACTKVNEEEETNGGIIYRFVNKIAAEIKKEYPDVLVDTLPYVYSTKPPVKEVLAENVSIRLCLMDTCREHSISDESCPYNEKVRNYFRDWAKHCSNIYLWDYAANFHNYSISVPNFKLLYQNMQRYIRFPIKGIMYQDAHTTVPSIEFGQLWGYLQAKLLWEPEMDYVQYLNCAKEFMQAYYGDGWIFLYDYLMLLMMQPSSDYHYGPAATCEQIIPMLKQEDGSLDMTFIRDANRLFDAAEAASEGEELERIRCTRLHLVWYELCTTYKYIRENGTAEEIEALRKKYENFNNTVCAWEYFSISEGSPYKGLPFDFDKDPNSYIVSLF